MVLGDHPCERGKQPHPQKDVTHSLRTTALAGVGLYMLDPGSGDIRKSGPVGVGVSLWAWALRPSS